MNFSEPNLQPEDSISINIKSSIRNQFIARVILIILLSSAFGILLVKNATEKYQKGSQLTQEKYLENFDRYKSSLIGDNDNLHRYPPVTIFVSLILMSFLIGSYELAALAISLVIGKILK